MQRSFPHSTDYNFRVSYHFDGVVAREEGEDELPMSVLLRVEPARAEGQLLVLARLHHAVLLGHRAPQAGKVVEDEAGAGEQSLGLEEKKEC